LGNAAIFSGTCFDAGWQKLKPAAIWDTNLAVIVMLKKFFTVTFVFFLWTPCAFGQSFSFRADTLGRVDTPGKLVILDADIKNLSGQPLRLRIIRVKNDLPPNWSTSICSGELCFPPDINSYTIPDTTLGIPPLGAGQISKFHLNFNTAAATPGSASVPIRVENINNPNEFVELTFSASTQPTGVQEKPSQRVGTFRLLANYPNPFLSGAKSRNPSTKIPFEIAGAQALRIKLRVYDLRGREIAVLAEASFMPGHYEAAWDGRDWFGKIAPSGLYFYELQAGRFREQRKMLFVH
jgi:hypothetical protein